MGTVSGASNAFHAINTTIDTYRIIATCASVYRMTY